MTPQRKARLLATLNRRQPDLTLIAEQVHKSRNIAALVRNCDAVGIARMHIVAPKEGYRDYSGTALGSDRWVRRHVHEDVEHAVATARGQGMKVYAAHFSDRARDYREVDYRIPCALLMGAEKQGISTRAAELADEHVSIPMMGMVSSFNVSTAAGIILVEAQHQRLQAGFYDQPRLPRDEIRRTLFEWGQREVARFCRQRGLAYPPLGDDGEIIDAPGWYASVRDGTAPAQVWPNDEWL
ncbi:tRNA (guanosine(18)-2'-O)-methyltransferase [Marinobacterium nitratireducens]|uniref:tRNA (guanosine(18)-2'-O)-methyltransferase n=1 Tax=Marinobacterium nitratireducens TaxID=518897 RepID=A0A918DNU8_9GAMM|nr:tRNA (guanosine(18)-2'-O)-methyltransferase TrmH [Marinobacterium nitratireducens]GGO75394.1 tRNA (guanosine(18)-2'-O)-methyltransferase [Marinobacterium nitratireducens]